MRAVVLHSTGHRMDQAAASLPGRAAIVQEFVALGRKHHIRRLRETTMLMRAFAELESLVRSLDPDFTSLPDLGIGKVAQTCKRMSAVRDAAGSADDPAPPDGAGRVAERHLLHASNRLAFALIIASIVVGSAIVIGTHAGPHVEGIPLLGIIGFIVAGALGVAWAVIALKSGGL